MATLTLYFATNRRHRGNDRWKPSGYGIEPSRDGTENLRFGRITLRYDADKAERALKEDCGFGVGNGEALARYFVKQRSGATIEAFRSSIRSSSAPRTLRTMCSNRVSPCGVCRSSPGT